MGIGIHLREKHIVLKVRSLNETCGSVGFPMNAYNKIESYDRLMEFGKRYLNDVFTLDGIQRVSARDKILREIISNLPYAP